MIDKIKRDLEERYDGKESRMDHVLSVAETAIDLGEQLGLDTKKLMIAASLHDITKYESKEYHLQKIVEYFPNSDEIQDVYSEKLWHTFSAYAYAIEEYHIADTDILEAILHHAIGAPNMNPYAEIIFLSDYIEPNRSYESSIKVRDIAQESIRKAIYEAINDTIIFHENLGETIPSIAYQAKKYYQENQEDIWKN